MLSEVLAAPGARNITDKVRGGQFWCEIEITATDSRSTRKSFPGHLPARQETKGHFASLPCVCVEWSLSL